MKKNIAAWLIVIIVGLLSIGIITWMVVDRDKKQSAKKQELTETTKYRYESSIDNLTYEKYDEEKGEHIVKLNDEEIRVKNASVVPSYKNEIVLYNYKLNEKKLIIYIKLSE